MLRVLSCCVLLGALCLAGCGEGPPPKVGISFGVGEAARWPKEVGFMLDRAKALGLEAEVRLNKTDTPKTQLEDCKEMIDNGIAVLILVPRDAHKAEGILNYAKKKNVKVISYARAIMGEKIDLFVGYDTYRIGNSLGLHLTEKVYKGNIAFLKGDKNDVNSALMHDGGMTHIRPLVEQGDMKVILDENVPDWSAEAAKKLLTEAIMKNDYKVDAVFAQNDVFAGVAAEVIKGLGIETPVIITGMDADLGGARRIVAGTQDVSVYMDLKDMAYTAVNEAYNLAVKKKPTVNSHFNNESDFKIDAYLINGKIVTQSNLDMVLISTGVYTREQVYGAPVR